MKKKDEILLEQVVNEIKKLGGVSAIMQIGSSVYSENYYDIDLIVYFKTVFPTPKLKKIQEKYRKDKLSIEGVYIENYKITRGMKVFIKSFNKTNKRILYGKNPFEKMHISINKMDVAHYIWYSYHIPNDYNINFEGAFPNSLHAMLTYKNVFPKDKYDTLIKFKRIYPALSRYLPKNPERFLRNTTSSNFHELYPFFKKSMEYFMNKN